MKNNELGKKLKMLRKNEHKHQQVVEDALCVTHTRLSDWERGKTEPDLDTLKALAKYFDVTAEYLLE